MSDEMLTFKEASEYTGMKLSSLYHYADQRYIKPVRLQGEKIFKIPSSELDWLMSEMYPDDLKASIKFVNDHPEKEFSTREVSEILGVDTKMVCTYIRRGDLVSTNKPPYIITGKSLSNWIDDRVHMYNKWCKKSGRS